MDIYDLRCEYLDNPLGIDVEKPRLSWKLKSNHRGARQQAYQIQCASSRNFDTEGTIIWDSGQTVSDQSIHVEYGGRKLESRERVYWRVKIWDDRDEESEWSEIAWWEMGLLDSGDWKARWIDPEGDIDTEKSQPAPFLRKEFHISGSIESVRLYITAHGMYEASINGTRIGDAYFTPGRTSYDKQRLLYQIYDITTIIHEGNNVLGMILGDGWYRGSVGSTSKRNVYGERLALLAQVSIKVTGKPEQLIVTDDSWKCTSDGPVLQSDLKKGDIHDARKALPGWNEPGYDDSQWNAARIVDHPVGHLTASMEVPVREKERFKPVEIITTPAGETVIDFGQNLAGYVEMHLDEAVPSGTIIKLIHGEALDENGNFTLDHIRLVSKGNIYQKDEYIHDGSTKTYKPYFSIKGFRYVKVEGYPGEIDPQMVTAIALYTDMEQTGDFQCSNVLINQLVKNTRWSQKGNFLSIPTDCPTRERSGWTGDAQLFCFTGSLLMNTAAFFSKWMKDVAAEQQPDGKVLNIVPYEVMPKIVEGSAGWGDAAVIIPWTIWKVFGDTRILADQYGSMKAWVEYQRNHIQKIHWSRKINPLNWSKGKREMYRNMWDTKFHFGEWMEAGINSRLRQALGLVRRALFSAPEVATAYHAYSARLLSEIATYLGKEDDARRFRKYSEKSTRAYQQKYLKKGNIRSKQQTRFVRPLALGLVPEEYEQAVADQLAALVKKQGYHVGTGFLSTPFLCEVLDSHGHIETAYKLINQTGQPSWLYAVIKGATTIWESWYGISEDGKPFESLNHYSYGAIVGWLFKTVVGIKPDLSVPGYKHFYLEPRSGGDLTKAAGFFDSP
ncbi:MAG: family 78 glycoside hydrolase catalytic domain, partial [Candidatus Odinarchaeota archaeon]